MDEKTIAEIMEIIFESVELYNSEYDTIEEELKSRFLNKDEMAYYEEAEYNNRYGE